MGRFGTVFLCLHCVLLALTHVTPLSNYFLREINFFKRTQVTARFCLCSALGEVMGRFWNTKIFTTYISAHEILQAVVLSSGKTLTFAEHVNIRVYNSRKLQSDTTDPIQYLWDLWCTKGH